MYCLSCGAYLPEDALFCLKCGKLTSKGTGGSRVSGVPEDASTVIAAFQPSDPYSSQPSSAPYGTQPPEGGTLNTYAPPSPYAPLAPPPPPPSPRRPQHHRSSSGFVKGLISSVLIVLLGAGIGTLLLLRQGAQTPSTSPTVKSTTTSQTTKPTVASAPAVLYQADWSTGLDGWVGSSDWKVQNGMLISDGTNQPSGAAGPTILAPYQVAPSGNFAIELRVQFAQRGPGSDPLLFHGSTTANGWQGYKLTACGSCGDLLLTSDDFNDVLGRTPFIRGTDWHTYRVEVRGPAMTVIVDGKTLFTATDSRFLSGGQVGIKSSTQLTVSSFKITSL